MAELLITSVQTMQSLADNKGISLHYEPISLYLLVDPDRFLQTLTNLLSNAIKFSEPCQSVWLRSLVDEDHVEIQVQDQGRGIPSDQLLRIFEPFQQVDASDSRTKGGTGLGLAICRNIIEQHEGRIWVESTLGQGSTFKIVLPLIQEIPI